MNKQTCLLIMLASVNAGRGANAPNPDLAKTPPTICRRTSSA